MQEESGATINRHQEFLLPFLHRAIYYVHIFKKETKTGGNKGTNSVTRFELKKTKISIVTFFFSTFTAFFFLILYT